MQSKTTPTREAAAAATGRRRTGSCVAVGCFGCCLGPNRRLLLPLLLLLRPLRALEVADGGGGQPLLMMQQMSVARAHEHMPPEIECMACVMQRRPQVRVRASAGFRDQLAHLALAVATLVADATRRKETKIIDSNRFWAQVCTRTNLSSASSSSSLSSSPSFPLRLCVCDPQISGRPALGGARKPARRLPAAAKSDGGGSPQTGERRRKRRPTRGARDHFRSSARAPPASRGAPKTEVVNDDDDDLS